ncbi:MAG: pkn9 [Myxococcaceae bacterium]|nr:pkn9 [Myxococcaceae bacterium]
MITHPLRSGGMGHVYEAKHPLIGRRVAVKVLRSELSDDGEVSARFLREARTMSAVKHRNVVEIHNFGQLPSGSAYMMMELIEGETLSEIIARESPMDPVRALLLCEEILSGLAAAHAVGVVHRDLKPGNIVLMRESSGDLVLKVLDFGLARQVDASCDIPTIEGLGGVRIDRPSVVAGTPEYISPEQASGKPVDGRGDLYAAGVVLFELLTGHLPFESQSAWDLLQLHRSAIPPLVSTRVPDVYPPLEAFVDRLLSKDPVRRAESAKAARAEVQKLGAEILALPPVVTPLLGPVVRWVPPPPLPGQKLRFAGRAAGLALLVGAASLLALSVGTSTAAVIRRSAELTAALPIAAPAPAPEPTIIPSEPVVTVTAAEPPARRAVAPAPKVRRRSQQARATPRATCEVNEKWRSQLQQQLEHLEQRSIAAIPDTANPSVVASVKNRARALSAAVSAAQGSGCAQVEAQVLAWKAAVR